MMRMKKRIEFVKPRVVELRHKWRHVAKKKKKVTENAPFGGLGL